MEHGVHLDCTSSVQTNQIGCFSKVTNARWRVLKIRRLSRFDQQREGGDYIDLTKAWPDCYCDENARCWLSLLMKSRDSSPYAVSATLLPDAESAINKLITNFVIKH